MNEKSNVQDDSREISMARLFGLIRGTSRIDVDATDNEGNPFELKTTAKGGVSTARDLGHRHIEKWRDRYWIIGRGRNLSDGFVFDRYFFLAPCHMEGWYTKILTKLGTDSEVIDKVLTMDGFSETELSRLEYILRRGILLNDPNIPWGYVVKNGIEISEDHAERLKELVKLFPR